MDDFIVKLNEIFLAHKHNMSFKKSKIKTYYELYCVTFYLFIGL